MIRPGLTGGGGEAIGFISHWERNGKQTPKKRKSQQAEINVSLNSPALNLHSSGRPAPSLSAPSEKRGWQGPRSRAAPMVRETHRLCPPTLQRRRTDSRPTPLPVLELGGHGLPICSHEHCWCCAQHLFPSANSAH